MEKTFENLVVGAIKRYASQFSSLRAAAESLGIKYETFRSWHNEVKSPTVESLSPVADKLGIKLNCTGIEPAKDVCFVNARIVDIAESETPPVAEDYIAAPLVGEVGAGYGYYAQENIEGWFLVYTQLLPAQHGRNLIAVQIGQHSNSMVPTLHPKDIVLIDMDDRDVSQSGKIMLVRDPVDDSCMIKRVSVEKKKGDCQITFYSDNAAEWKPTVYSLVNDFDSDFNKAIVGHVIWVWADMRGK